MTMDSTKSSATSIEGDHFLCDDWSIPWKLRVRTRIRGFIEELLEAELDAALGRARYERPGVEGGSAKGAAGSRHGHRERRILGLLAPRWSACRAPGWRPLKARRANGGTRRFPPTNGARNGPTP